MLETYCGKRCEECAYQEKLACPGCKVGPGGETSEQCDLAKCCCDKGQEDCASCPSCDNCHTLRGRNDIPEYRFKAMTAEAERREILARKGPFLSKWYSVLFWLIIPRALSSILTNGLVLAQVPALFWPGAILDVLTMVVTGIILLKLSAENDCYPIAGTCAIAACLIGGVETVLTGGKTAAWSLFLTLPAGIIALLGTYFKFKGHREEAEWVGDTLSRRWRALWHWYIGTYAVMYFAVFLEPLWKPFFLTLILLCTIVLWVLATLELIYLYRMAKRFRELG